MNFKNGVDPKDLSPQMWIALWQSDSLHMKLTGHEVTCTNTGEGMHKAGSRHYNGGWKGYSQALNIRTWRLKDGHMDKFVERLKRRLGEHYRVVVHTHSIHIQWTPVWMP